MKVWMVLFLAFTGLGARAQATLIQISTMEVCQWNGRTDKFEHCETFDSPSYFEVNESQTTFKHYTEEISSTYFVREIHELGEDGPKEYKVISDAGNNYVFIWDQKNDLFKVLGSVEEGNRKQFFLMSHHIDHTSHGSQGAAPQTSARETYVD